MNEKVRIGSDEVEPPVPVTKNHEKYAEIMNRLSETVRTLSNSGINRGQFRRLSEIACMKAIRELKEAGFEMNASPGCGGPPHVSEQ
jgi:hypothetical protein